jgi:hypothetical protein
MLHSTVYIDAYSHTQPTILRSLIVWQLVSTPSVGLHHGVMQKMNEYRNVEGGDLLSMVFSFSSYILFVLV